MQLENILSDSLDIANQGLHYRTCGCIACKLSARNSQQVNNVQEGGGDLTIEGLISSRFSTHTKNAMNASAGETFEYYIHNEVEFTVFDDDTYGDSLGHSLEESDFVRSIFNRIDKYIDLDFSESRTWDVSTFDIYYLDS